MVLTRSTRRRVLLEPRLLACHRRTTHLTALGTWATMTVQHVCRRCSPGLRPMPGPAKRLRRAMLQRSHLNCSRQPTNQSIWHNDNIIRTPSQLAAGSFAQCPGQRQRGFHVACGCGVRTIKLSGDISLQNAERKCCCWCGGWSTCPWQHGSYRRCSPRTWQVFQATWVEERQCQRQLAATAATLATTTRTHNRAAVPGFFPH